MSVTRLALAPTAEETTRAQAKPIASYLDNVAAFIPGDVLAIYLSFFAFLESTGARTTAFNGGWYPSLAGNSADFWLVISLLVLTPGWVLALAYSANTGNFVWPVWKMAAAFVAFYVYVMAFEDVLHESGPPVAVFGGLVIVIAPVLALVDSVVARAWPDQALSQHQPQGTPVRVRDF